MAVAFFGIVYKVEGGVLSVDDDNIHLKTVTCWYEIGPHTFVSFGMYYVHDTALGFPYIETRVKFYTRGGDF